MFLDVIGNDLQHVQRTAAIEVGYLRLLLRPGYGCQEADYGKKLRDADRIFDRHRHSS